MKEEEVVVDGTNNNPTQLLDLSPASSIGDVRDGNVPPSEVRFYLML